MRTLRKLVLGETWALPLGLAVVVGCAFVLRELAPAAWRDAGGFALLAGVGAVLVLSVESSARRRR